MFAGITGLRRPRGPTFVSYSYDDGTGLQRLKDLQLPGSELRPFPPISVAPFQMVSTELLSAINACSSFIFIDTPGSRGSRWVALETDYARRVGKRVFSFEPEHSVLRRDRTRAMDLSVFPSYSRDDASQVMPLLSLMKNERYFDVFTDTEEILPGGHIVAEIESGLSRRLERGGYAVLFWTTNTARSAWVQREVERVASQFPKQVLPVLLGEVPFPETLANWKALRVRRSSGSELDMRDVDDVIVWLYWLIQSHRLGLAV
jgi:TIR domain